jgi:hypothetical protein
MICITCHDHCSLNCSLFAYMIKIYFAEYKITFHVSKKTRKVCVHAHMHACMHVSLSNNKAEMQVSELGNAFEIPHSHV